MLGVPVDGRNLEEVTNDAMLSIDSNGEKQTFACANAHSIVVAQNDPEYMQALQSANLVVADGVGVTMMGRVANIPTGPHITGDDYFNATMTALVKKGGGTVFFFGSSQNVLDKIKLRVPVVFDDNLTIGTLSPPFRDWSDNENNDMLDIINTAKPDILWVGMTAPKQEKWVQRNRDKLNAPVVGSIGAVFDFFAQTKPSAPKWMRRFGLEWLFRSISEPKRVGGKRIGSIIRFVWLVIKKHIISTQK